MLLSALSLSCSIRSSKYIDLKQYVDYQPHRIGIRLIKLWCSCKANSIGIQGISNQDREHIEYCCTKVQLRGNRKLETPESTT